jgi:hypothetical protein
MPANVINATCCDARNPSHIAAFYIRATVSAMELRVSYPATVLFIRFKTADEKNKRADSDCSQYPTDFYLDAFPVGLLASFAGISIPDDRSSGDDSISHVLLIAAKATGVTPKGPDKWSLVPYDIGWLTGIS